MLEDLGLSAVVVGFILTWDNIINMFVQPYVGTLSDRTHTRFGRRKPWMMAGAPLAALFFILVPFVPSRPGGPWLAARITPTRPRVAFECHSE
jgi:Na+/melibiose symporter-like transporter